MRLNRDNITTFINQTISRRAQSRHDLLSAYLCGSFLDDNYLLGGSGDVDLVFVLAEKPEKEREIIRLSGDLFLDISNRSESEYRDTRSLRVDPWRGPEISTCRILYDPQHFMDFVQASVRGQFDRPDHIFRRAKSFADQGRAEWLLLLECREKGLRAAQAAGYLRGIGLTLNAAASLGGSPLAERRLMLEFPSRAENIGEPGLFQALLGLLGSDKIGTETMEGWKIAWTNAFEAVQGEDCLPGLHPARLNYYQGAFDKEFNPEQPDGGLWILLKTWAEIASCLPEDSEHWKAWSAAFSTLGLAGPSFDTRIEALDALLDNVEEILETWGRKNGI